MRFRQHHALVAGIAVLAASAAVLEVATARLFTVVFGQAFEHVALGLPILGAALGATLLSIFPALARPPSFLARAAYLAATAAAATLAALIVFAHVHPYEGSDAPHLGALALVLGCTLLPFVLSGSVVASALRHAPRAISPICAAVLVGGGAGVVLANEALAAGALRVGLLVSILQSIAAIAFYAATTLAPSSGLAAAAERRPSGSVVSAFALASAVLFAGDIGAPWLRLPPARTGNIERADVSEWSEYGLISVDRAVNGTTGLRINGLKAAPILDGKAATQPCLEDITGSLRRDRASALVIDPGGGRAVRVLAEANYKSIRVIESNPELAGLLLHDRYAAYTGKLYYRPGVEVQVGQVRGVLGVDAAAYDTILLPRADPVGWGIGGDRELSEDRLLTVEGVRELLLHLTPTGALIMTLPEDALARVMPLFESSLGALGAPTPRAHLFAAQEGQTMILIVARSPLSSEELSTLRAFERRHWLVEIFSPGKQSAPAPTVADLPTDDRPFFHTPSFASAVRPLPQTLASFVQRHIGWFVGLALGGLAFVLGLPAVLVALLAFPSPGGLVGVGGRLRPLIFFAATGLGAALIGRGLHSTLSALLGHPTHPHTAIALLALLAGTIGCAGTAGVRTGVAHVAAVKWAVVATIVAAVEAASVGLIVAQAAPLPLGVRGAVCVLLLAGFAAPLGALVALCVRLVSARALALVPVCLGVGLGMAFFGVSLGLVGAAVFGHSVVILTGSVSLLIAAASLPAAPTVAQRASFGSLPE